MNLPPVLIQRFFDSNAKPLSGGSLYTYAAGTSTPQATYTDQGGGTPNANPVVLDANGQANVWLDPSLSYKFILKDVNGVTQWTVDNVVGILTPNAVNTASLQNGAVTSAKLSTALGANQVLGANAAGTALEAKSITAGPYVTVTNTVGGIQIAASGSSDTLVEQLNTYDPGIEAGEAISAYNAICLDLNYQTYKYFLCNSSVSNRRLNFIGFAKAAATVTAGIYTWTDSADLVTSNTINWSINGRSYTQAFTTDNNTTLTAIASKIASDQDVASAVVTAAGSHDVLITITSKGGLSLTIPTPTVTGGASQAVVTIAATQLPSGSNVACHAYGPLSGFVGLSPGARYYLSNSAGGITSQPTDSSLFCIGQAISSTVLYVFMNTNLQFGQTVTFIRAFGGGAGETRASYASDVEHFNFSSWLAGIADSAKGGLQSGEISLSGLLVSIDGVDVSSVMVNNTRQYNKSSWSAGPARTTARQSGGNGSLSANLYAAAGYTAATGTPSNIIDKYNGSTWTNSVATLPSGTQYIPVSFSQGGKVRWIGGGTNFHDTYNGTSTGTDVLSGVTAYGSGGCASAGSQAITAGIGNSSTNSLQWSGTSWSSSIPLGYTPQVVSAGTTINGPASGFNGSTNLSYHNGGTSAATTSINTTGQFNGASWSLAAASSSSRAGATGGTY